MYSIIYYVFADKVTDAINDLFETENTDTNTSKSTVGNIDDVFKELSEKNFTSPINEKRGEVKITAFTSKKKTFDQNDLSFGDSGETKTATTLKSIEIPGSLANASYTVVIGQFLLNTEPLPQPEEETGTAVSETILQVPGVSVISINIRDQTNNKKVSAKFAYSKLVPDPSTFVHDRLEPQNSLSERKVVQHVGYTCQFFDDSLGQYSTFGCSTRLLAGNQVDCSCNHTTVFAVLLSVSNFPIPKEVRVNMQQLLQH